jgi:hypothetical protein
MSKMCVYPLGFGPISESLVALGNVFEGSFLAGTGQDDLAVASRLGVRGVPFYTAPLPACC